MEPSVNLRSVYRFLEIGISAGRPQVQIYSSRLDSWGLEWHSPILASKAKFSTERVFFRYRNLYISILQRNMAAYDKEKIAFLFSIFFIRRCLLEESNEH